MNRVRNRNYSRNNQKGTVIAEYACGLAVIIPLTVLLVAMGINSFFAMARMAQLRVVAIEAAHVVDTNKYWMGVKRPDYNAPQARQQALAAANTMCQLWGLPAISDANFNLQEIDSPDPHGIDVVKVEVSVNSLQLPFNLANVFGPLGRSSAVGVSAYRRDLPYAYFNIHSPVAPPATPAQYPASTEFEVAQVPSFGFFVGQGSTPNGNYVSVSNLPGGFGRPGQLWTQHFRGLALDTLNTTSNQYYGFSNKLYSGMNGNGSGVQVGVYPPGEDY